MRVLIFAFAASLAFGQTSRVFELTHNQTPHDLQAMATLCSAVADLHHVSIGNARHSLAVEGDAGQIAVADWLVRQLEVPAAGPFPGASQYHPPAGGDDVVRVFYVTQAARPEYLAEIATVIRAVGDIRKVFLYDARKAVAVRGSGAQVALAAWIVDQLNQPAQAPAPAPHEYKLAGDDVARVFALTYPQTPQQLQEIVTLLRSITDIPRLFVCNARRSVILRGPAARVALAAWLVSELDRPLNGAAPGQGAHEYHLPGDAANLVRVFYLTKSHSPAELQKAMTQVRLNARIQRLFVYSPLGALAVRGTPGQVATAERVLEEMKAQ
jgi:hypothetical protein